MSLDASSTSGDFWRSGIHRGLEAPVAFGILSAVHFLCVTSSKEPGSIRSRSWPVSSLALIYTDMLSVIYPDIENRDYKSNWFSLVPRYSMGNLFSVKLAAPPPRHHSHKRKQRGLSITSATTILSMSNSKTLPAIPYDADVNLPTSRSAMSSIS